MVLVSISFGLTPVSLMHSVASGQEEGSLNITGSHFVYRRHLKFYLLPIECLEQEAF